MFRPSYRVTVRPLEPEEGVGFLASVPELPGCMSDSATPVEARANVRGAVAEWLAQAEAMGRAVPWSRLQLVK